MEEPHYGRNVHTTLAEEGTESWVQMELECVVQAQESYIEQEYDVVRVLEQGMGWEQGPRKVFDPTEVEMRASAHRRNPPRMAVHHPVHHLSQNLPVATPSQLHSSQLQGTVPPDRGCTCSVGLRGDFLGEQVAEKPIQRLPECSLAVRFLGRESEAEGATQCIARTWPSKLFHDGLCVQHVVTATSLPNTAMNAHVAVFVKDRRRCDGRTLLIDRSIFELIM